jgi:hypothetical protein
MFVFFGLLQKLFVIIFHLLKICERAKFHGPSLTGAILHPPQYFENPIIAIFKSSVKKYYFYEICSHVNYFLLYQPSLSVTAHKLSP